MTQSSIYYKSYSIIYFEFKYRKISVILGPNTHSEQKDGLSMKTSVITICLSMK